LCRSVFGTILLSISTTYNKPNCDFTFITKSGIGIGFLRKQSTSSTVGNVCLNSPRNPSNAVMKHTRGLPFLAFFSGKGIIAKISTARGWGFAMGVNRVMHKTTPCTSLSSLYFESHNSMYLNKTGIPSYIMRP
jgi:hypothetical protein